MSDLALFVAACIRDKVVLDLMEENKRLRKVIEKYNDVQITGSSGYPMYSSGKVNVDAPCDTSHDNWHVSLLQNRGCKLNELLFVEIWKYGTKVGRLVDLEDCCGSIEMCSGSDSSIVVLTAGVGISHVEIGIHIEGMPLERWQSLQRLTGSNFVDCLTTACSPNQGAIAHFQYIVVEDEQK